MGLRKVKHLQCDWEMTFLSNDYTNLNTDPNILMTLTLTLTHPHDAFENFCERYFVTLYGTIFLDTSIMAVLL